MPEVKQATLDVQPSAKEKKAKARTWLKDQLVRWNLTKEQLTGADGKPVKDTILTKAMKFLEMSCVEKHGVIPLSDTAGFEEVVWIVKPMLGYNITSYTVRVVDYGDFVKVGCNCQYGLYDRLCSHALAVLIELGWADRPVRVVGGVRDKRIQERDA